MGLDLHAKAPSTALFTFECGKPPSSVRGLVEGSVIAPVSRIDLMVEAFKFAYKETAGNQAVRAFEGGANDTLTTQIQSGAETKSEETGLKQLATDTNEELLEIKAK